MPNRCNPIVQCSKAGDDLKVFASVEEACLAVGLKDKGAIYKAIKYGLVAKGFRWRYQDAPLANPQSYDMRQKPIIASKDGNDTEYPNLVSASEATGASVSHIQQVILTGGKAKGYRFRVKGEKQKALKTRRSRTIVAIDDMGKVVYTFTDSFEAASSLGVGRPMIYWCLNPKNKECRAHGYWLRYADDLK